MKASLTELDTPRLRLRRFVRADAAFVLELLNDAAFLRYIGDRNVRSLADAERYLEEGPIAMYAAHRCGLLAVEQKSTGALIGMCGLLRRETLSEPDIGFALASPYRGHGYAREAAAQVMSGAFSAFGLPRVLALTDPDNAASIRTLSKLGFVLAREEELHGRRTKVWTAPAPGIRELA